MANEDQHRPPVANSCISMGSTGNFMIVLALRLVLLAAIGCCSSHLDTAQLLINSLWKYLTKTWVYNSVYFETWFVTLVYALMTIAPLTMDKMPWFDRFKIDSTMKYSHTTVLDMIKDAIIYVTPLMFLDTVKIKKYNDIDQEILREKMNIWIQKTMTLPRNPPLVGDLLYQLVASIVLFDAIFFFFHYALHRHSLLYKYIHRYHHDHETIYCHVTNQLTIPERVSLIVFANISLKVFSSHPLTRTVFIPVFLWMLVDNHSGYDLPWGLHRIIPFGIYGGPVNHYRHHDKGSKHYQPFLTYLDKLLDFRNMISKPKQRSLMIVLES